MIKPTAYEHGDDILTFVEEYGNEDHVCFECWEVASPSQIVVLRATAPPEIAGGQYTFHESCAPAVE